MATSLRKVPDWNPLSPLRDRRDRKGIPHHSAETDGVSPRLITGAVYPKDEGRPVGRKDNPRVPSSFSERGTAVSQTTLR